MSMQCPVTSPLIKCQLGKKEDYCWHKIIKSYSAQVIQAILTGWNVNTQTTV